MLECFALTQRLSSCAVLIGSNDSNCVMKDEDATPALKDFALFGWFVGKCDVTWVGDDVVDGMCLNISSNPMFTS